MTERKGKAQIRDLTMDEFYELVEKETLEIRDTALMILKGHIIIEYALNCYLESISIKGSSDFFKETFTFSTKIKLIRYFGHLGSKNKGIIRELELLNSLRNDIAHSLDYNENNLIRFLDEIEKKKANIYLERNRYPKFEQMKIAISFLAGLILGAAKSNSTPKQYEAFLEKERQFATKKNTKPKLQ